MARSSSAVKAQQLPAGARKPAKTPLTPVAERLKIIIGVLASKATAAERHEYFAEMAARIPEEALQQALELMTEVWHEAIRLRSLLKFEIEHLKAQAPKKKQERKLREAKAEAAKKPAAEKSPIAKPIVKAPAPQKVVNISSVPGTKTVVPPAAVKVVATSRPTPAPTPAPTPVQAPVPAPQPSQAANDGQTVQTEWRTKTGAHPSVRPEGPAALNTSIPTPAPTPKPTPAPTPAAATESVSTVEVIRKAVRSSQVTGRPTPRPKEDDLDLTAGMIVGEEGSVPKPPWPGTWTPSAEESSGDSKEGTKRNVGKHY